MSNTSGQQSLFAGETDDDKMAASNAKKASGAAPKSRKSKAVNAETMAKRRASTVLTLASSLR